MGTITFRTATQAAIFKCELIGQFSDGHWEHLRGDHWKPWCKAEVKVGPIVGRDFLAIKDNYNVASKDLLEAVGQRMKGYASVARVLGLDACEELKKFVSSSSGFIERPDGTGEYWDKKKGAYDAAVLKYGQYAFDTINDPRLYGDKELRMDLREIKRTMKTRI